MPVIVVGKMLVRRGPQTELPSLDVGEFGFGEDTSRVFIGYSPVQGDPSYQRAVFPFQNVEALTEFSPRVWDLFNSFMSSVDDTTYYLAATIPQSNGVVDVEYVPYSNASPVTMAFMGSTLNARADYLVYDVDGAPIRQGKLRLLSDGANNLVDDDTHYANSSLDGVLSFNLSSRQGNDIDGYFFTLQATNNGDPVNMFVRITDPIIKTIPVLIANATTPQDTVTWDNTTTGNLGTFTSEDGLDFVPSASDSLGFALVYTVANGSTLPDFLSLNFVTGEMLGEAPDVTNATFYEWSITATSTGTGSSNSATFSLTVDPIPPVQTDNNGTNYFFEHTDCIASDTPIAPQFNFQSTNLIKTGDWAFAIVYGSSYGGAATGWTEIFSTENAWGGYHQIQSNTDNVFTPTTGTVLAGTCWVACGPQQAGGVAVSYLSPSGNSSTLGDPITFEAFENINVQQPTGWQTPTYTTADTTTLVLATWFSHGETPFSGNANGTYGVLTTFGNFYNGFSEAAARDASQVDNDTGQVLGNYIEGSAWVFPNDNQGFVFSKAPDFADQANTSCYYIIIDVTNEIGYSLSPTQTPSPSTDIGI